MSYEQQILNAFRSSDERGRKSILDYAVSMAEDWPAPCDTKLLGAVGAVDAVTLSGGKLDDIESPPVVGPPV